MTDVFSTEKRSAVMRRVKGRDTAPELKVRKALTALGVRYRLNRKDLPGSPDIVMAGRRLAIFVHGCFWHGHDCARGSRVPKANRDYWLAKVARNRPVTPPPRPRSLSRDGESRRSGSAT